MNYLEELKKEEGPSKEEKKPSESSEAEKK
jgi:hypothetical protein